MKRVKDRIMAIVEFLCLIEPLVVLISILFMILVCIMMMTNIQENRESIRWMLANNQSR